MAEKKLLTVKEVCAIYRISRTTLSEYRKNGKVTAINLWGGKHVRFNEETLAREIEVLTGKAQTQTV